MIVVSVLAVASFAFGSMRPAHAAGTTAVPTVRAQSSLVCLWVPMLNLGLC